MIFRVVMPDEWSWDGSDCPDPYRSRLVRGVGQTDKKVLRRICGVARATQSLRDAERQNLERRGILIKQIILCESGLKRVAR